MTAEGDLCGQNFCKSLVGQQNKCYSREVPTDLTDRRCDVSRISAQKAFFSPFKYILLHSSHSFIVEEIQLSKTSYWRNA